MPIPALRILRFCGEIVLFSLGALCVGVGLIGTIILASFWRSSVAIAHASSGHRHGGAAAHLWRWALVTLGIYALGGLLLFLYKRYRQPTPWDVAADAATPLPPPAVPVGWTARVLATLRILAGSGCILAAMLALSYGLIGGGILSLFSTVGDQTLSQNDRGLLQNVWWTVPLGFLLIWAGYLCLTTRADLERLLRGEARRHLLATADSMLGGSQSSPAARPLSGRGITHFGWRGLLERLAILWAGVGIAGGAFVHVWQLDAAGAMQAAEVSLLLWLGTWGLIFVHELGHVLGARLTGTRATGLRVGRGPCWLHRTVGGLELHLHAWPTGGGAYIAYDTERHFRWRSAVLHAGGPLAHGLAVAGILWTAHHLVVGGAARALVLLGLWGAWYLVWGSLMPLRANQVTRAKVDFLFLDAAALLNDLRLPDFHVRWRVCVDRLRAVLPQAFSAQADEQAAGAGALTALLSRYPENELLSLTAVLAARHRADWLEENTHLEHLLALSDAVPDPLPAGLHGWARGERVLALAMAGHHALARTEGLAYLASEEQTGAKIERLDELACLPLMRGLRGYESEALEWADHAIALAPERVTLQGTRGSLLVEMGRLPEGQALLEKVRAASPSSTDQGICALYLAIVVRRQGGPDDEAAALAAEAFRLYPGQPWMETRWEQELASKDAPIAPLPVG